MNSMRCSWRNSGSFGAYDMKIKIKSDNLRRERNIGVIVVLPIYM